MDQGPVRTAAVAGPYGRGDRGTPAHPTWVAASRPLTWSRAEPMLTAVGGAAVALVVGCVFAFQFRLIQRGEVVTLLAAAGALRDAAALVAHPAPTALLALLLRWRALWAPLGGGVLASVIPAALSVGLATCLVTRIAARWGAPRGLRLALAAAFALNPWVVLLAATGGFAAAALAACLLGALDAVIAGSRRRPWRYATAVAAWLTAAAVIWPVAAPVIAAVAAVWSVGLPDPLGHASPLRRWLTVGVPALAVAAVTALVAHQLGVLGTLTGPWLHAASRLTGAAWGPTLVEVCPLLLPLAVAALVLRGRKPVAARRLRPVWPVLAALPVLGLLGAGPLFLTVVAPLGAALMVILAVPAVVAVVARSWSAAGRRLAAITGAVVVVLAADAHGVQAMPAGLGALGRALFTTATPAVIVGGSAADGWHDKTGQGYIRRALTAYDRASGLAVVAVEHAVPGSPMVNPHVARAFPGWMRETAGGVVVLAWGLLNDARLHIPLTRDRAAFTREMRLALDTRHVVLLVSPPATLEGATSQRRRVAPLWAMEVATARRFARRFPGRIHVLNVMGPEQAYIRAHGQTLQDYMQGTSWDPNTKGHQLAARLLVGELEGVHELPRSLPSGIGATLEDPRYVARFVLARDGSWAYVEPASTVRALARFVKAHPRWTFLVDLGTYWELPLLVHRPGQLVTEGDPDFAHDLHRPAGRVTAFIVPQPASVGSHDRIDETYPALFGGGLAWATAVWHNGTTRIFRVGPGAP